MSTLMDNKLTKLSEAMFWRFFTVITQFIAQTGIVCVLARLLPVSAFGTISQAMILVGLVGVFSETGMSPYIIQRKTLSESDISNASIVSLLIGVISMVLILAVAPLVGLFFQNEKLPNILYMLSQTFVLTGICITHTALMHKNMQFRSLFIIELTSYLIGYGIVGVISALKEPTVWSLAYAIIAQSYVKTVLTMAIAKTVVLTQPNFAKCWNMLRESTGFSAAHILLFTARNIDYILIGKLLGPVGLGLYSRSYQFSTSVNNKFTGVINTVMFPYYAKQYRSGVDNANAFLSCISLVTFVMHPIFMLLALHSDEIIYCALGSNWTAAGPVLKYLSIGCMALSLHNLCETMLRSGGKNATRMKLHSIYLCGIAVSVWIGSTQGIDLAALLVAIWLYVQFALISVITCYVYGIKPVALLKAILSGLSSLAITWILLMLDMVCIEYEYGSLLNLLRYLFLLAASQMACAMLLPDKYKPYAVVEFRKIVMLRLKNKLIAHNKIGRNESCIHS